MAIYSFNNSLAHAAKHLGNDNGDEMTLEECIRISQKGSRQADAMLLNALGSLNIRNDGNGINTLQSLGDEGHTSAMPLSPPTTPTSASFSPFTFSTTSASPQLITANLSSVPAITVAYPDPNSPSLLLDLTDRLHLCTISRAARKAKQPKRLSHGMRRDLLAPKRPKKVGWEEKLETIIEEPIDEQFVIEDGGYVMDMEEEL